MQCYLDGGDYKAAMQVFEKIPTVRNNIIINNSVLLLLKVLNTFTLYFTFYFDLNFNSNFSLDFNLSYYFLFNSYFNFSFTLTLIFLYNFVSEELIYL